MAPTTSLTTIARQYRASLAMLRQAIELCPEPLWLDDRYPNRYWHIAYHALFYTHLYIQPTKADFQRWAKHQEHANDLSQRPQSPYTQSDILDYHEICAAEVEAQLTTLDLEAPSGFPWLPFNKLEVQFYNIRHLQHHTGQLADRLRTQHNIGLLWVRPD